MKKATTTHVAKTSTGENDVLLKVRQGNEPEGPCVEVRKFRAFGGTVMKLTVNCPSFRTGDLDEFKKHIEVLQRAHEEARKLQSK